MIISRDLIIISQYLIIIASVWVKTNYYESSWINYEITRLHVAVYTISII